MKRYIAQHLLYIDLSSVKQRINPKSIDMTEQDFSRLPAGLQAAHRAGIRSLPYRTYGMDGYGNSIDEILSAPLSRYLMDYWTAKCLNP